MPHCCSQLITQYAIGREHELTVFELPLYREEIRNGYPHKHWVLWDDQIATILHRNREVVRNLRQEFSGVPHYTTQEIFRTYAIPTLQFLMTDEECSGFSWL